MLLPFFMFKLALINR